MAEQTTNKKTTKAKPPKKHVSPEEKYLTKMWKLIFSSLTARGCGFAYIFPGQNRIILSNSTSPKAKNELKKDLIVDHEAHGDRLMSFSDANLSIHIVDMKDMSIITKLKNLLGIVEADCRVWCLLTTPFLSFINNNVLSDLKVQCLQGQMGDIYLHLVPKGKRMEPKNLIGFNVVNYHVVQLLWQYLQTVPDIWTEAHMSTHNHILMPVDTNPVMVGKVYGISVPFKDFVDNTGNPLFPQVIPIQQVIGLDGLSTVSLKEFIRKINNKPFRFDLYLWMYDCTRVLMMTLFENEMMRVWSIRPNLFVTAMSNSIRFIPFEEMPQPSYN